MPYRPAAYISLTLSSPGQGATHKGITADHLRDIYESDTGSTLANDYATIQALERERDGGARASAPDTGAATTTTTPTPEVDAGG